MNAVRSLALRPIPEGRDELPDTLHPVVHRILLSRGVFNGGQLSLRMNALLRPGGLTGIETAAQMLATAITEDRSVLVVGDFDADGAIPAPTGILCRTGS